MASTWIQRRRRWIFAGIALFLLTLIFQGHRRWRENSQDRFILSAASHYGIHPALVKAIVWRESGFDPFAHGSKGELGLMQLMPTTAEEWARHEKESLFVQSAMLDPGRNTRAGTWYLKKLYQRYLRTDNPLPYALADYNAGRGNVLKWAQGTATTNSEAFVRQIGFPTTRAYVIQVMKRYQYYSETFAPPTQARNGS